MLLLFTILCALGIFHEIEGISFTCSNSSCPGSEVTFTCSVASPTLIWSVYPYSGSDPLGFTVSTILPLGINSKGASETNGDFTVVFTDDNNGVTSEIQFTANESLDKWIIKCADGGSTEDNKNCTIHITNPPSNVPIIMSTSIINCHALNVSWVYDSEDDEINVEKYMIDVEPPPEDGSCIGGTCNTNNSFYILTELQYSVSYSIRVKAINCAGNGNYSNTETKVLSVGYVPPPTSLSTSVLTSCNALNITWEPSSYTGVAEDTLKYHLEIDSESYTTYNTSYVIDQLTFGMDYTISLNASVCEQEMSESVNTSRLICIGGSNLVPQVLSCDSVMLSWDETSDNNSLYIITPPTSGECIESCNTTDTSITISGLLINEREYNFTLKSGFCECEIKTSIPKSEPPPAIQNLELKECDNATKSVILQWISPDISSNDVPIASYNIMITPTPSVSGICSDGSCTVNNTDTSVSISGLQYGMNHTIEIVPVNYCNQTRSPKVVHCKPMQDDDEDDEDEADDDIKVFVWIIVGGCGGFLLVALVLFISLCYYCHKRGMAAEERKPKRRVSPTVDLTDNVDNKESMKLRENSYVHQPMKQKNPQSLQQDMSSSPLPPPSPPRQREVLYADIGSTRPKAAPIQPPPMEQQRIIYSELVPQTPPPIPPKMTDTPPIPK